MIVPASPDQAARHAIALEHLDDLRRLDRQIAERHRRMNVAVQAANTSVTDIVGVGSIVAAMVIGHTGDVTRLANRDHYAATPEPHRSSCPREAGSCTASPAAATGS